MNRPDWWRRLAEPRILVVGDVMLDRYWTGEVDRISPEAPVPVVTIGHEEERLGGAANVARNIQRMGGRCELLSVVGDDAAGARLQQLLADESIAATLQVEPAMQTTVKLRVLARHQQLIRLDFERPPGKEVLREVAGHYEQRVAGATTVLLSDYGKGGLTHIRDMIDHARAKGVPVMVDPKGRDFERYRGVHTITPNLKEFQLAAGEWDDEDALAERALALIRRLDIEQILLTRSEQGMTLFRRDGLVHSDAATARDVFDVSGAGDTVIAAFSLCQAAGVAVTDSMRFANAAAGVVVSKLGAAAPGLDEIAVELDRLSTAAAP